MIKERKKIFKTCLMIVMIVFINFAFANPIKEKGSKKEETNSETTVNKKDKIKIKVKEAKIFTKFSYLEDSPNMVGEYTDVKDNVQPGVAFGLIGLGNGIYLKLTGEYDNSHEQNLKGAIDYKGKIKAKFKYNKLPHTLDHDPVKNVREVQGLPPARKVFTTDYDANAQYSIDRSVSEALFKFSSNKVKGLSGEAGFRVEEKSGYKQAISFNMCLTCHVSSHSQRINEVTQDYTAKLEYKMKHTTISYKFTYRDFENRANAPLNFYEGPTTNPDPNYFDTWITNLPPSFSDKRTYKDETLPFNLIPNTHKQLHELRIVSRIGRYTKLSFYGLYSSNTNEHNNAEIENTSAGANLSTYLTEKLTFQAKYNHRNIDNDDIYFAQIEALSKYITENDPYYYPDKFYYSALSRTEDKGTLDFEYKLTSRSRLRVGWEGKWIDRDHFLNDETTVNKFIVSFNTRFNKKLRVQLKYIGESIDNPFENPYGGLEKQAGEEYLHEIYSNFFKTTRSPLTSEPDSSNTGEVRVIYNPTNNWNISTIIDFTGSSNDDTHWANDTFSGTLNISYSANSWQAGLYYNYFDSSTRTFLSLFDGKLHTGELVYHHGSLNVKEPYDEQVHSIGINYFVEATNRLNIYASAYYVIGKGNFDTSDFKGYANGEGAVYVDLSDFNEYSNHDNREFQCKLDFDYLLDKNLYFTATVGYVHFRNPIIYIQDLEGTNYYAILGLSIRP
ncbi:hypothetical protein TTHT_2095 [Thermotomaculum hydrothermale]|uniref:Uncharacterized protein n=1 Tax=Thermotomaculum hydrothermale TaxID=981385 RepID=A0A7R6PNY1_9BACT|nr:MtrB/PioB family outer membrane beta-barrel protein [Thermotomaculum hydrothermale]BBB33532.1 hypothetical protein TTHT_2095 [Thermotomaculum hydrothermale]